MVSTKLVLSLQKFCKSDLPNIKSHIIQTISKSETFEFCVVEQKISNCQFNYKEMMTFPVTTAGNKKHRTLKHFLIRILVWDSSQNSSLY